MDVLKSWRNLLLNLPNLQRCALQFNAASCDGSEIKDVEVEAQSCFRNKLRGFRVKWLIKSSVVTLCFQLVNSERSSSFNTVFH